MIFPNNSVCLFRRFGRVGSHPLVTSSVCTSAGSSDAKEISMDRSFHTTVHFEYGLHSDSRANRKNMISFWWKIDGKTCQYTCTWSRSPFKGFQLIYKTKTFPFSPYSKRIYRVLDSENKNAEKNVKKGAGKIIGSGPQKIAWIFLKTLLQCGKALF